MTEVKCSNCRESFVARRQYDEVIELSDQSGNPVPIHEIARFCPYCGSTSLSLIVKEGEMTDTKRTEPAFNLNEVFAAEPDELAEEEEKPRRHSKR